MAMLRSRSAAMKPGVLKVSLRTSTTWRSVWPSKVFGSRSRKAPKSASSYFLCGANCQSRGPSFGPEFGDAGLQKARDRVAGFRQHPAVDRVARAFQREHEAVRHFRRPFAISLRRLRRIEGAVDLDRGQVLAGVFKLARMRQALGVEHAAPRRIGPAADPGVDLSPLFSSWARHSCRLYHGPSGDGNALRKVPASNGHDERRRRM